MALQIHIEMTAEMVQKWCEEGEKEIRDSANSAAVQQADAMQQELPLHCFFLNKAAKQVYSQWIQGLKSE